ncbi:hypothetical protein BZL29_4072 [Mycobacterium kansasii]|uniref:Uncharacterized protein n=1 Tax=Mycobacterium kansasii TaxID=1768 RepID=A0A1V3X676_MYCKA|nr:hypothetical protein BZL29_4072 [Mycobacterium kansasii]
MVQPCGTDNPPTRAAWPLPADTGALATLRGDDANTSRSELMGSP